MKFSLGRVPECELSRLRCGFGDNRFGPLRETHGVPTSPDAGIKGADGQTDHTHLWKFRILEAPGGPGEYATKKTRPPYCCSHVSIAFANHLFALTFRYLLFDGACLLMEPGIYHLPIFPLCQTASSMVWHPYANCERAV